MSDFFLIKIITFVSVFIVMAAIYGALFLRFSTKKREFDIYVRSHSGSSLKSIDPALIFPKFSVAYGYVNENLSLDWGVRWQSEEKSFCIFYVERRVMSAWSFYSTILAIDIPYLDKSNIIFCSERIEKLYYLNTLIKRRGASFFHSSIADSALTKLGLREFSGLIRGLIESNRRFILDINDRKLVIVFYGKFFSNVMSLDSILNHVKTLPKNITKI